MLEQPVSSAYAPGCPAAARSPQTRMAIAHSTWSQASTCPSGHAIPPEGSCIRAMYSPVATMAARSRASAAPGLCSSAIHPPRRRLDRVHHQALADQRVQRLLGPPGKGRLAHDVPDQQLVVRAGQPVLVIVHADRALEPPVRRVQPVRVVVPQRGQPGPGQLGFQLDPGVDAHVAAGRVVVLRGQRPADPLGQEGGHRDGGQPARPQHPGQLVHGPLVVQDVLEDLGRDHPVERAVTERHGGRVPGDRPRPGLRADLARPRLRHATLDLDAVPAAAAAQAEHPAPAPDREPAEINGQHGGCSCPSAPPRAAPPRAAPPRAAPPRAAPSRAAMAFRYCSAVAWATAGQANRSLTRRSARSDSAARSAGAPSSRRSTAARCSSSPGLNRTAASPATSGSDPESLATSGVPEPMCSTAGSENPSYSEATTAISALASSSASASSDRPWVNRTRSPRDSWACSFSLADPGLPTTIRCASVSVTSLAIARSSVATPLSGESELATATIRPGTRGAGRGWNTRVSTPSGMIRTFCGRTPKSRQMSSRDEEDTVSSGACSETRRATRACIRTNPYQRRLDSRAIPRASESSIRRSTLIGWCTLVTSGSPSRGTPSSP